MNDIVSKLAEEVVYGKTLREHKREFDKCSSVHSYIRALYNEPERNPTDYINFVKGSKEDEDMERLIELKYLRLIDKDVNEHKGFFGICSRPTTVGYYIRLSDYGREMIDRFSKVVRVVHADLSPEQYARITTGFTRSYPSEH